MQVAATLLPMGCECAAAAATLADNKAAHVLRALRGLRERCDTLAQSMAKHNAAVSVAAAPTSMHIVGGDNLAQSEASTEQPAERQQAQPALEGRASGSAEVPPFESAGCLRSASRPDAHALRCTALRAEVQAARLALASVAQAVERIVGNSSTLHQGCCARADRLCGAHLGDAAIGFTEHGELTSFGCAADVAQPVVVEGNDIGRWLGAMQDRVQHLERLAQSVAGPIVPQHLDRPAAWFAAEERALAQSACVTLANVSSRASLVMQGPATKQAPRGLLCYASELTGASADEPHGRRWNARASVHVCTFVRAVKLRTCPQGGAQASMCVRRAGVGSQLTGAACVPSGSADATGEPGGGHTGAASQVLVHVAPYLAPEAHCAAAALSSPMDRARSEAHTTPTARAQHRWASNHEHLAVPWRTVQHAGAGPGGLPDVAVEGLSAADALHGAALLSWRAS